jgi:ketosteroid isomerase-like protein
MSQENVEIVTDTVAAFNRGDLDTASDYWTDDLDYRAAEGAPDDPGPIHGKAAMRAYVEDWLGTFDDFRGEVTEFINAADVFGVPPDAQRRVFVIAQALGAGAPRS